MSGENFIKDLGIAIEKNWIGSIISTNQISIESSAICFSKSSNLGRILDTYIDDFIALYV
jgi:hypothetical protein